MSERMYKPVLALLLFFAATATSIVIRDDVDDSKYVTTVAEYPFVTGLMSDPDTVGCSATLVAPRFAVLAAHCLCHAPKKPSSWPKVKFAEKSYSLIKGHTRSSGCVYDCKADHGDGGPDKCDVALLETSEDVTDVDPLPVYNKTDEQGQTFRMVGWGVSGRAGHVKEKKCEGDEDGKLRHAENTIEVADKGVLQYTMHKPSDGALPLEGIAESGDSGSPLLLTVGNTTYVAGVNSGSVGDGNSCNYGAVDEYNRLSDSYDWIQSVITGNAVNTTTTVYRTDTPMSYVRVKKPMRKR